MSLHHYIIRLHTAHRFVLFWKPDSTRLCTNGGVETTASIFTGLSEYSVLNYYHINMLGHPSYLKRQNSTMKWCGQILFILLPNTDYYLYATIKVGGSQITQCKENKKASPSVLLWTEGFNCTIVITDDEFWGQREEGKETEEESERLDSSCYKADGEHRLHPFGTHCKGLQLIEIFIAYTHVICTLYF